MSEAYRMNGRTHGEFARNSSAKVGDVIPRHVQMAGEEWYADTVNVCQHLCNPAILENRPRSVMISSCAAVGEQRAATR